MDLEKAKQILTLCASYRTIKADKEWSRDIESLKNEIDKIAESRTIIAALGTAILAKATDPGVWAFALKVDADFGNRRGYSARNLAMKVLAANQGPLNFFLGGVGREPLNNQPFYGKPSISKDMVLNAKKKAKPAFQELIRLLQKLESKSEIDDFEPILCAFLTVCKAKPKPRISQVFAPGPITMWKDMALCIQDFCTENQEGGRRAQAVAAGLCDALAGKENVFVDRVNSPSRRVPGDVHISDESKDIHLAIEVRAKAVGVQDVYDFMFAIKNKSSQLVSKIAVLGVWGGQENLTDETYAMISARAEELGLHIRVYLGWDDFIEDTIFWSSRQCSLETATNFILDRLVQLDVSERSVEIWKSSCRQLLD